MNPCEHPDWPTGNQRPVSRRYALRVFRVTPGSTVTSKSSGWISRTCSMFLKLKHTPPWRMMTQTNTGNKTYDSYHQDDILLVIVVTKDVNCSKWEKVWPHKYLTFIAPTPPSKPVPVPKGMMGRRCLWQTFAKALTSSTQRGNTTTSGGRHLHIMQCCHILFFLLLQRTTPILPTAPSSWARNHSSPHTFLPQVVSPCKSVLDVQANASGVSLLFSNKSVWIYMFSCYNQYSTDQLTPRTFANVLRQHLAAEVALLTAMLSSHRCSHLYLPLRRCSILPNQRGRYSDNIVACVLIRRGKRQNKKPGLCQGFCKVLSTSSSF